MSENRNKPPYVLIVDFSLVLSIDSSAAAAIVKMKENILKKHQVQLCLWVSGNTVGFPTEYRLSSQLDDGLKRMQAKPTDSITEESSLLLTRPQANEGLVSVSYQGSRVCESLDIALMEAEDALVARVDPSLLDHNNLLFETQRNLHHSSHKYSLEEEKEECLATIKGISPVQIDGSAAELLFTLLERETYSLDNFIWRQGDASDSVKFLIHGQLLSELENEAGTTEIVVKGSIIGELGLINGDARMSSIRCTSNEAILYSMSRVSFENLAETNPRVARVLDLICIKYLALRVQHVSNRIFETRYVIDGR